MISNVLVWKLKSIASDKEIWILAYESSWLREAAERWNGLRWGICYEECRQLIVSICHALGIRCLIHVESMLPMSYFQLIPKYGGVIGLGHFCPMSGSFWLSLHWSALMGWSRFSQSCSVIETLRKETSLLPRFLLKICILVWRLFLPSLALSLSLQ